MNKPRLVDMDGFQRRVGSLPTFRKAALVFVGLLPGWKGKVSEAVSDQDWNGLGDHVHQMKGTCGMLCALMPMEKLAEIEGFLAEGELDNARKSVHAIIQLLGQLDEELKSVWLEDA